MVLPPPLAVACSPGRTLFLRKSRRLSHYPKNSPVSQPNRDGRIGLLKAPEDLQEDERMTNYDAVIGSITGSEKQIKIDLAERPYDTLRKLADDDKDGFLQGLFTSPESFNKFKSGGAEINRETSLFTLMDGKESTKDLDFYTPYSEQLTELKMHDKTALRFMVTVDMTVGN